MNMNLYLCIILFTGFTGIAIGLTIAIVFIANKIGKTQISVKEAEKEFGFDSTEHRMAVERWIAVFSNKEIDIRINEIERPYLNGDD